MTDAQVIGLSIFLPMLLLALGVILTGRVDDKPKDHVAEYKRRIAHNGFKSRIGRPYRSN